MIASLIKNILGVGRGRGDLFGHVAPSGLGIRRVTPALRVAGSDSRPFFSILPPSVNRFRAFGGYQSTRNAGKLKFNTVSSDFNSTKKKVLRGVLGWEGGRA